MVLRIAIDLIWVKVGKVGGAESFVRNLIEGIKELDTINHYYLITTQDNDASFRSYESNNIHLLTMRINSEPVKERLLWQNLFFENCLISNEIFYCFCPVYLKPLFGSKRIKYITVIHDLQQLHYPEYFSKIRYCWTINAWRRTISTSEKIVAISNYVRNDIQDRYRVKDEKVVVIYDPIIIDNGEEEFERIESKYGIKRDDFFFALSAMLRHKNLNTLISIMKKITHDNIPDLPRKLIISGINGDARSLIETMINENNLQDNCILTGYITNKERNSLYSNCTAFLFPSVFEGFGMPVIEGLMYGARVITTRTTAIPETSQEKAVYINDPYNVDEWIEKIILTKSKPKKKYDFTCYDKDCIAAQYIKLFTEVFEGH